jgi:hypothetical protein
MKHTNLFFISLLLLLACGCTHGFDYRLSNSVFIEDIENPRLPIYSERGYNSFGVYWGLSPFTTEQLHDPSIIVVENDTCHIHFSGVIADQAYTLMISIPDYLPHSFNDLLSLDGTDFNLSEQGAVISLLSYRRAKVLEIIEGTFSIQRVQNLYVDKSLHSVVLSGTFSFKALLDEIPTTFSKGRFDMRFGDENFYFLQDN